MAESMGKIAREDEDRANAEDDEYNEAYWEGFADALWTLGQHIRGDVKTTCFPVGSCECHPFVIQRSGTSFWQRWRAWYDRIAGS